MARHVDQQTRSFLRDSVRLLKKDLILDLAGGDTGRGRSRSAIVIVDYTIPVQNNNLSGKISIEINKEKCTRKSTRAIQRIIRTKSKEHYLDLYFDEKNIKENKEKIIVEMKFNFDKYERTYLSAS